MSAAWAVGSVRLPDVPELFTVPSVVKGTVVMPRCVVVLTAGDIQRASRVCEHVTCETFSFLSTASTLACLQPVYMLLISILTG